MNTATGTRGSKHLEAENSRKLKLVPRPTHQAGRRKFRIGICDGVFSTRTGDSEKGSGADESPAAIAEADTATGGSGKWLAIAAISLAVGFFIGNRRK